MRPHKQSIQTSTFHLHCHQIISSTGHCSVNHTPGIYHTHTHTHNQQLQPTSSEHCADHSTLHYVHQISVGSVIHQHARLLILLYWALCRLAALALTSHPCLLCHPLSPSLKHTHLTLFCSCSHSPDMLAPLALKDKKKSKWKVLIDQLHRMCDWTLAP